VSLVEIAQKQAIFAYYEILIFNPLLNHFQLKCSKTHTYCTIIMSQVISVKTLKLHDSFSRFGCSVIRQDKELNRYRWCSKYI